MIERLHPGAAEPGQIVHIDGRILGEHKGIIRYTVGQRRGLGISSGEPLYVVKLDANRKQVIVGPREALLTRRLKLREVNCLARSLLLNFPGMDWRSMPRCGLRVRRKRRCFMPCLRAALKLSCWMAKRELLPVRLASFITVWIGKRSYGAGAGSPAPRHKWRFLMWLALLDLLPRTTIVE